MGDEPWKDLKSSAGKGVFQIDKQVGVDAAKAVANALDVFDMATGHYTKLGTKTSLDGRDLYNTPVSFDKFDHFGNYLQSGIDLSKGYQDAGNDLINKVLPAYVAALNDMADAFIIGGKVLEGTDKSSSDLLKEYKTASTAGKDVAHVGMRDNMGLNTDDPEHAGWTNVYAKDGNQDPKVTENSWTYGGSGPLKADDPGVEPVSAKVEPTAILNWPTAHKVAFSFGDSNRLMSVAGEMYRMAARLDVGFFNFSKEIDNLTKERWKGESANQAKAAVERFTAGGQQLTAAVQKFGKLMENGGNWVFATMSTMPGSPDTPPTDTKKEFADIERAQKGFDAFYRPGVADAVVLPKMPPPMGIGKPETKEPPKRTTTPGPPGPPGNASPGSQQQLQAQAQQRQLQAQAEQQRKQNEAQQKAWENQQRQAEQDAQRRAADQQRQQQQQAAQQAMQQAAQQAQQIGQQAAQAAQQMGQQLASAAQQAAQQAGLAGLPGIPSLKDLEEQAKKAMGSAAAKGGSGAGGGPGSGSPVKAGVGQNLDKASKLFPRAEATATGTAAAARAGLASSAGMGMGPGPGPGAAGQQKEHKRADFLDSTEHLEEAIGEAPTVVKPIVEQ
jgi:hypothetical protein